MFTKHCKYLDISNEYGDIETYFSDTENNSVSEIEREEAYLEKIITRYETSALERAIKVLKLLNLEMCFDGLSKSSIYILVAEAINFAAKVYDESIYLLKEELVYEAVEVSLDEDEDLVYGLSGGIYYLYTEQVGAASFHIFDWKMLRSNHSLSKEWVYGWSGIYRQDHAFELLKDECLREEMAKATAISYS